MGRDEADASRQRPARTVRKTLNKPSGRDGLGARDEDGSGATGHTPAHFPQWDEELAVGIADAEGRDLVTSFLFAIVCLSMIAVIGVLVWQIISLLRLLTAS